MKVFIFSRRFLVPFFITWLLYLGFFVGEMWRLYGPDLRGKGFPDSVKLEWSWYAATGIQALGFLLAFLIGATYYSHFKTKKNSLYRPFSLLSIVVLMVIAVAGFFYVSFSEPRMNQHRLRMLSDIVYAGSYKEYLVTATDMMSKNEKMMTLPELYKAKDSLSSLANQKAQPQNYIYFNTIPASPLQKVKYELAKKIAWPSVIIIFYVLAVLLGTSFRKTYAVFPLLIAWLGLFYLWYLSERYLEIRYRQGKTGVFFATNGVTLMLAALAIIWFLLLRKNKALWKTSFSEVEKNI